MLIDYSYLIAASGLRFAQNYNSIKVFNIQSAMVSLCWFVEARGRS
jgi:hypothetical protein